MTGDRTSHELAAPARLVDPPVSRIRRTTTHMTEEQGVLMAATLDEERENGTGDLTNTDEHPVLHAPAIDPLPQLLVNYSLARNQDGARCIGWGKYRLSAAEAHALAIEFTDAADHVADLRTKQGFDT